MVKIKSVIEQWHPKVTLICECCKNSLKTYSINSNALYEQNTFSIYTAFMESPKEVSSALPQQGALESPLIRAPPCRESSN